VVDNEQANLDLACSILEASGYDVIEATGAREGLEKADRHPPDLILSDVCMSEGSGYDFIRAVKANTRLARIPFVFITSTMLEDQDRISSQSMASTVPQNQSPVGRPLRFRARRSLSRNRLNPVWAGGFMVTPRDLVTNFAMAFLMSKPPPSIRPSVYAS